VADDGSPAPQSSADDGLSLAVRRRGRRLAWLYTAAAVVLLPWIVYLALTLPRRQYDRHYRAAWVGFDLILVFAISRTAYLAFRFDPRVQFPATATAVLLFVDAWFDITTSANRDQFFEAVLLALLVEIPSALFSLYLAYRVNRRMLALAHLDRARAPNRWWGWWHGDETGLPGDTAAGQTAGGQTGGAPLDAGPMDRGPEVSG
jgi:hypothetical protein